MAFDLLPETACVQNILAFLMKNFDLQIYKKFILRGKIFEIRKELSLQRKCRTSACSTISLQKFVSTPVLEM